MRWLLLGFLGVCLFGYSGLDFETIQRAKAATAVVLQSSGKEPVLGTAFCIDAQGYFVTNAHVVKDSDGDVVTLVLHPGLENQLKLEATIVKRDAKSDLALLKVEHQEPFQYLELGADDRLFETMELVALGYPFGRSLAVDADQYPAISVNTGKITALRRKEGKLVEIQTDAQVNPGNSGGPLIDQKGTVVGVITTGIRGSGVNFALPVSRLQQFLDGPVLRTAFPASVAYKDRGKKQSFRIFCDVLPGGQTPDEVRIYLGDKKRKRTITTTLKKGVYEASEPLMAGTSQGDVDLRIKLKDAVVEAMAKDTRLNSKDGKIQLSDLVFWDRESGAQTIGGDLAALTGLDSQNLTLTLAGKTFRFSFKDIDSLEVTPKAVAESVAYRVVALAGDREIGSIKGEIALTDLPQPKDAVAGHRSTAAKSKSLPTFTPELRPPQDFTGLKEIKLPSQITDVQKAGGGRYLLLRMDKLNQIAVFDVTQVKFVKYLSLPSPGTLVASGLDALFLVIPETKIIQRVNLETFKTSLTKALTLSGVVIDVGMGYASRGPLMIRTATTTGPSGQSRIHYVDPNSFQPIEGLTDLKPNRLSNFRYKADVVFSADGTVFGVRSLSLSPSGVTIGSIAGGKFNVGYEHTSAGHILPGPKGEFIYTGRDGIYSTDAVKLPNTPTDTSLFPTTSSSYFIGTVGSISNGFEDFKNYQLQLYVVGGFQPIAMLPKLPELMLGRPNNRDNQKSLRMDQYFHFIIQAEMLLTIPVERNRLVVRRLDIAKILEQSQTDYFFIDSLPVTNAVVGKRYTYQLRTKSKAGDVTYNLESAPNGMRISSKGLITWRVPSNAEEMIPVIILARDGSGQEVFHSFTIKVQP